MDALKRIYEQITFLRQKGVKMKEMAEHAGITPSVFSAIYSTVLPAYFKNLDKGEPEDTALNNALIWVNNVSKKKLLGSLSHLENSLSKMEATARPATKTNGSPILSMLAENMNESVKKITNYSGIYISYSISSNSQAMKIEPYLIAPSENKDYIEVGHNSAYGTTHWGVALMNGTNHLYMMFNENQAPQLALFHICLKLPMYERPPFLRGIYTCLDYNYNPIARRILFVKHSDSIAREEFLKLKGELKNYNQLADNEKIYYKYTCQPEDAIRICNVLSPQMNEEDLIQEKKILSMYQEVKEK